MIKQMAEYPFPGKNVFSSEEECFKEQCFLSFGMKVRLTLLLEAACAQRHLYIWVDNRGDYQEHQLISCYIKCFELNENDSHSFYVSVLDFKTSLVDYAYGHAIGDILSSLKNNISGDSIRALLDYSTHTFVLVCDSWSKIKEDKYKELCYSFLKKYDYYNVIEIGDLRVKFLTTKDARKNNDDLNDIFRMNAFTNCHNV